MFFAFSGQNRAFSHHFRTTRNSENFLTTYLTTVGAGAIRLVASVPAGLRKLNSSKVPGNILSENLFLCFLRISFYPYILFIIEKHHVLCYNMAVQLLIPYRTCHCKRHFIEKRLFSPIFRRGIRCCKNSSVVCEDCTRYSYEKKTIRTEIVQLATMDFPLRACVDSRNLSDSQDLPNIRRRTIRCI